jgi:hypothetical protein
LGKRDVFGRGLETRPLRNPGADWNSGNGTATARRSGTTQGGFRRRATAAHRGIRIWDMRSGRAVVSAPLASPFHATARKRFWQPRGKGECRGLAAQETRLSLRTPARFDGRALRKHSNCDQAVYHPERLSQGSRMNSKARPKCQRPRLSSLTCMSELPNWFSVYRVLRPHLCAERGRNKKAPAFAAGAKLV